METEAKFEQRKVDHIQHCLDDRVDVAANAFDPIKLIHEALPDINFDQVDISKFLLSHTFSSPIFISSMTAGHAMGQKLNYVFAAACEQKNWLFNVGSQRKQLGLQEVSSEWNEIKQNFPKIKICANLGIAQVITSKVQDIEKIISSIDAIGLIIHLNPLQEVLQIEGTPQFKGGLAKIIELSKELSVPVIVKETGCGFSVESLKKLNGTGVAAVDLAGYGGTHWGRVEGLRAEAKEERLLDEVSKTFSHWGETTLDSLMALQNLNLDYKVWASGGVRNGLDVAKCISMGASAVGMARPFLQAALKSQEELLHLMTRLEYDLKVALFCTGSLQINDLKGKWKWIGRK